MLKYLLTLLRNRDPHSQAKEVSLAKRVLRLEMEMEELRTMVEATWARQRKVEGTVHGMRGANARHPSRLSGATETLEEFRERMISEGRIHAHHGDTPHGEH